MVDNREVKHLGVVCDQSNGAIFSDLDQPLTQFSRSRYSLTLNIL